MKLFLLGSVVGILLLLLVVVLILPAVNCGPYLAPPSADTETMLRTMNDIFSSRLVATADVTSGQTIPLWWKERWRYSGRVAADIVLSIDCRLTSTPMLPCDSIFVTLSSVQGVVGQKAFPVCGLTTLHATLVSSHVVAEQESLRVAVRGPLEEGTMVATAFPRFR